MAMLRKVGKAAQEAIQPILGPAGQQVKIKEAVAGLRVYWPALRGPFNELRNQPQTNKCPICRTPVDQLLEIKIKSSSKT